MLARGTRATGNGAELHERKRAALIACAAGHNPMKEAEPDDLGEDGEIEVPGAPHRP